MAKDLRTFLSDLKEKRHAMECMIRQLDSNADRLVSRLKPERLDETLMGRINIEGMTGKKSEEVKLEP
jgi:hypothetical protein